MTLQEFLDQIADYLDEKMLWYDFREWMENSGYKIEEMPEPFNSED